MCLCVNKILFSQSTSFLVGASYSPRDEVILDFEKNRAVARVGVGCPKFGPNDNR